MCRVFVSGLEKWEDITDKQIGIRPLSSWFSRGLNMATVLRVYTAAGLQSGGIQRHISRIRVYKEPVGCKQKSSDVDPDWLYPDPGQ